MGKPKMAAQVAGRKAVKQSDPIPALYREMHRLDKITGNSVPHYDTHRVDLLHAMSSAIYCTIQTTPADTIEGVARQLQLLGTELNNAGEGKDGCYTVSRRFWMTAWLAVYGALNLLLPQCEQVPGDGYYSLADLDCRDEALGLFRRLLAGDYGEPAGPKGGAK